MTLFLWAGLLVLSFFFLGLCLTLLTTKASVIENVGTEKNDWRPGALFCGREIEARMKDQWYCRAGLACMDL